MLKSQESKIRYPYIFVERKRFGEPGYYLIAINNSTARCFATRFVQRRHSMKTIKADSFWDAQQYAYKWFGITRPEKRL